MEQAIIITIGIATVVCILVFKLGYDLGKVEGLKKGKLINETIKYERNK